MELNKIYNLDCFKGMKQIETGTIDLIVSDPPYQLTGTSRGRPDQTTEGSYGKEVPFSRQQSRIKGFMGKEWDVLPSVEILKECLRVLKDGAFAFWLMTPRQDSQMEFISRLKEAGFVISFSPIYWTYASGFPKASNISNLIAKREGAEREGAEREGAGSKGNTFPLEHTYKEYLLTDNAKQYKGSYAGLQLKPAVEVIVVSMKPLSEKTYVDQALKNGKGITWLDNCRIPYENKGDIYFGHHNKVFNPDWGKNSVFGTTGVGNLYDENLKGRFPANLLVSDDVLNDGSISTSQPGFQTNGGSAGLGCVIKGHQFESPYNDSGSTSRYFSLDAWWQQQIKKLPDEVKKVFPFLIVPKTSSSEKNEGLDDFDSEQFIGHNRFDKCKVCGKYILQNPDRPSACKCKNPVREDNKVQGNIHPTTKPIQLMSYLITLGSREQDVILDPFIGSGTTAISARILSRRFIGFEREQQYFEIANGRLREYMIQKKLDEVI